jgi:hypothetical protein
MVLSDSYIIGVALEKAREKIGGYHGEHRVP